ncbi:MAG: YHYH protein [Rhodospirillaceae bacterium]|nr:YHYH protein [Rhodospirillaceae bacterium]
MGAAQSHGVKPTAAPKPDEKAAKFDPWSFLTNPAQAAVRMSVDTSDGYRFIRSDGIPDHQPGSFPNHGNPHAITEQSHNFRVSLSPIKASSATELGHQNFGVALNGVPFDPLTAEFWNRDRSSGWNIEAMSGSMNLGLDRHNAHVQPTGAYHYHALPTGLIEQFPFRDKPALIGYAADGFPIYGPFGYSDPRNAGSQVVALRASFRVKSGTRPSGPGGAYDGTYVQDYEYAPGIGDLDACNGRDGVTPEFPNGTYYYVITTVYPFIPRCWTGDPDSSFNRGGGGGGANMGSGALPHMRGAPGGPSRARPTGMRPRQGGGQGGNQGGRRGGPPDLNAAAARLGISVDKLRRALGPPPPNFERAARQLGISAEDLRGALHP